jgi:hypothetical protein
MPQLCNTEICPQSCSLPPQMGDFLCAIIAIAGTVVTITAIGGGEIYLVNQGESYTNKENRSR